MANWHYYNDKREKIGPFEGKVLKQLAQQGIVTPETFIEDPTGRTGLAKNVKGLKFADTLPVSENPSTIAVPLPPKQPVPVPSPGSNQVFCTNCGNAVSEQAVACMACGAKPVGHKKFCRQCGVAINSEQVVCIKCGAAIGTAGTGQLFNDGMSRIATLSTNFNVGGKSIGDIMIFAAAGIAFISFLMPWIEATIPHVGKVSKNGFSQYAFWLGIFFIYPVWMTLAGKKTSTHAIGWLVCAGMGTICGIGHIVVMYCHTLDGLDAHVQKMAEELTSFGMGVFVFFCAYILLIAGIVLTIRSSTEGEDNNISPKDVNFNFNMFWICVVSNFLWLIGCIIWTENSTTPSETSTTIMVVVGGVITFVTGVMFLSMLIYQLWKLIPADIARTTPEKAVGFLFIPLFNFYRMFVVFNGLGKDMNKTLKMRNIQYRVREGLGLTLCVLTCLFAITSVSSIDSILTITSVGSTGGIQNITVLWLISLILLIIIGIFFFRSVKNGAIALLEQEGA